MKKSIATIKQSIETIKNSLKTLRSELDDIENKPDGPASHREFVLKADKIDGQQEQLDDLEATLKKWEE